MPRMQDKRAEVTLEVVSFRCEPETRKKLDELISVSGLSQSELLRRLILSATVQAPKVRANLVKVISQQRQSKAAVRRKVLEAVQAVFAGEEERDLGSFGEEIEFEPLDDVDILEGYIEEPDIEA